MEVNVTLPTSLGVRRRFAPVPEVRIVPVPEIELVTVRLWLAMLKMPVKSRSLTATEPLEVPPDLRIKVL